MASDTGVGCLRLPGGTEGALAPWSTNPTHGAVGTALTSADLGKREEGGQLSKAGPCPQDPTGGAADLSR